MRGFVATILFLLCSVFAQNALLVEAFDEQSNNSTQLTLRVRVTNNLNDTLNDVHIRYFLDFDSSRVLDTAIHYLPNGSLFLDTVGNQIAVNIEIPQLPPGTTPNASGISIGLHYVDWLDFRKMENFSYPNSSSFIQTDKISLWQDDAILYGIAPAIRDSAQSSVQLKFSAIRPENAGMYRAFVEIRNVGSVSAKLDSVSLLFSNGQRYPVGNILPSHASLSANENVKILLDSLMGPNVITDAGEFLLEYASSAKDYVVWGHPGIYSVFAQDDGLWDGVGDFLRIREDGVDVAQNYIRGGIYFRQILDVNSPYAWQSFSPYEEDGYDLFLPISHPFSSPNGISVMTEPEEPLNFAWTPVWGAEEYRLTILSEDSTLVHRGTYIRHSVNIGLPYGKYFWAVEAKNRYKPYREAIPKEAYSVINNVPERTDIVDSTYLNVPSYRGRKDTRLLNLRWGEFADLRGWDEPHTSDILDEDEGYRCWAIGIQELNHRYGGNLTQDEIIAVAKMHVDSATGHKGPALAALGVGKVYAGGSDDEILYGLQWALKDSTFYWRYDVSKIQDSLLESLRNHAPVYVTQKNDTMISGKHVMVVDAFRIYENGEVSFRFLNIDNYGSVDWRKYGDSTWGTIVQYISITPPSEVQMSDPTIDDDPDYDGLMTFDEIHRFFTNPNYWDSDSDGVGDKAEIYSYTIREQSRLAGKRLETDLNLQELLPFIQPLTSESLADVDGDSLRAELDKDSDDDGLVDGDEDLNGNGKIDDGETDPHGFDLRYSYIYDDVPDSIILYSRSYLRLNDGVKCLSKNGLAGSSVASELGSSIAVVAGVEALVNEIYSRGQVWLRNNAKAGFVRYYGLPGKRYSTILQEGATIHREFNKELNLWPWRVSLPPIVLTTDSIEILIRSGESYTLNDGENVNLLKVESGGILYLSTGEMTIGNLQLDAGSKVVFLNPGYKTVLRVKDDISWNSSIEGEASMSTIASGFKLIYHGDKRLFINGQWAGTLVAPNAKLVLGQTSNKNLYGRFLGNGISVHQYSVLRMVPFSPKIFLYTANNGGLR